MRSAQAGSSYPAPAHLLPFEPGIYLPEFGVRSKIDMMTSETKAWVTGKIQRELVRI